MDEVDHVANVETYLKQLVEERRSQIDHTVANEDFLNDRSLATLMNLQAGIDLLQRILEQETAAIPPFYGTGAMIA